MIGTWSCKRGVQTVTPYGLTLVLCLAILVAVLRLWQADLRAPLAYDGDALFTAMQVKSLLDSGWFHTCPRVGAPGGGQLYDFPMADNLHFLVIKVLSLAGLDCFTLVNLYFLLTFPLAALSALFVLRHFQVRSFAAVAVSLLFAFLPYHFYRGTYHLFLAAYYLVPLMGMVVLWLYLDSCPLAWRSPRLLAAVVICLLTASAGVYYAFFAGFLLLAAGLASFAGRRQVRTLLATGFLIAVLTAGFVANIAPSLLYTWRHGDNPAVHHSSCAASEKYGLKMAQLLLPLSGHRCRPLAEIKARYDREQEPSEARHATLGTLGSVGFLLLLGRFCLRRDAAPDLAGGLALLNAAALLLGTVGSLGSLFAVLVDPAIRGYNRVCVYIAFCSLFAVALVLEKVFQKVRDSARGRRLFQAACVLLLILGVLDQTNRHFAGKYRAVEKAWANDADFVRRIEALLPAESMVFQLPCVAFPEAGPTCRMTDYDHFRGYLHSKALRWSYGAMKGRPGGDWLAELQAKPIEVVLPVVVRAGFRGLWLDRCGYEDAGGKVVASLKRLLGEQPLSSRNGRFLFFDLRDHAPGGSLPARCYPWAARLD
jgi:phosphoglycerol transferase